MNKTLQFSTYIAKNRTYSSPDRRGYQSPPNRFGLRNFPESRGVLIFEYEKHTYLRSPQNMRFMNVDVLVTVGSRLFVPVAQSMTDFVTKDRASSSSLTKTSKSLPNDPRCPTTMTYRGVLAAPDTTDAWITSTTPEERDVVPFSRPSSKANARLLHPFAHSVQDRVLPFRIILLEIVGNDSSRPSELLAFNRGVSLA